MNVGDLVGWRLARCEPTSIDEKENFLVVGKGSYNRLLLLKANGKVIEIHPDWLEVVSESR